MTYSPPAQPVPFALEGEYAPPGQPVPFELGAGGWAYSRVPGLVLGSSLTWRRAGQQLERAAMAAWNDPPACDLRLVGSFGQAAPADVGQRFGWNPLRLLERAQQARWGTAAAVEARVASGFEQSPPVDQALPVLSWRIAGLQLDTRSGGGWQAGRPADGGLGLDFRRSREHAGRDVQVLPLYTPGEPLAFTFGDVLYAPPSAGEVFFSFQVAAAEIATRSVDSGLGSSFGTARRLERWMRFRWGWGRPLDPKPTGITYPDYPGPVIVIDPPVEPDILETYMIANSVSLVVLPSRTPLDATSIKASLDIDSFSWKFSADLFGRTSLNLVRPDASGPKTVELEINGWKWLFLVERYSRQVKFPGERYSITGASRTQLLAEPYAPKRSAVNGANLNARQAAEEQLQFTGFTLNWDATGIGPPDWTLPAGAFSYQDQTAMQVIARVAEAVGAVVRPSREADALTVLPRYREAVWFWGSAIMDRIIPGEIVTEVGGEWSPQPVWNSVYVSGTTHGVAVDVRRTGTAGDQPAPDVYDDLVTATDAARSRGICEISKGGDQEIVSLPIPLFPVGGSAPGLVEPAMLCEVREPGDTWRGLCLATEISATGVGASKVTQALRLERHHGSR
ncbi:hypothetical protein M2318_005327 [Metapseudomonas resinovorans]|uniref:hypothetical protein n=1 Tax=Metapseudomonas resinovorans TaxID=53412 RepID=UPI003D211443